jgi:hypothetical protein
MDRMLFSVAISTSEISQRLMRYDDHFSAVLIATVACFKAVFTLNETLLNRVYEMQNVGRYKSIFAACVGRQKGKGKAVPLHAMEALGGRGGIAPTHSRPRHYMGVSVTPRPRFYPRGKDPRYPLYRRLGGSQSRSGHRG